MDSITNVISLQEQLDAHIKDELETKNFQKAINTFLNEDSVKKLVERSISLRNSASCNFEDKMATLIVTESSQFSSFDAYSFCIYHNKGQIEKVKDEKTILPKTLKLQLQIFQKTKLADRIFLLV